MHAMNAMNLPAGQLLRLEDAQGVEVACDSGRVWITEERSLDDVWLGAGQSVRLARAGLAILEATQAARIRLIPPVSRLA
jgi:Protein of unknown function (DUF2917)